MGEYILGSHVKHIHFNSISKGKDTKLYIAVPFLICYVIFMGILLF